MKISIAWLTAIFLLGVAVVASCTTTAAIPRSPATGIPYTEADVRFMQGMIVHHQQALEMAALVPDRSSNDAVRLLARRIEASQHDEIAMMRSWLERRGEALPDVAGGHHAPHGAHGDHADHADHTGHPDHADRGDQGSHGPGATMRGMLSPEDLARMASARGEEFDRLFLAGMIRHHEGALQMVAELFATDGAAQETEIFRFASHVDSDQRVEIARMARMLQAL